MVAVETDDKDRRMKHHGKILRAVLFLIAIAAPVSCLSSQEAAGERTDGRQQREKHARIAIEKTFHDFGQVIQGEKAVVTFAFRNTGDHVLNIEEVTADHGNITTVLSDKSLDPRDEGTIEVILDTTGLQGSVIGRIKVLTNDENRQETVLKVTAGIEPLLALDPPFLFAGQLARGAAFSGKARLGGTLVEEGGFPNLTITKSDTAIEAMIERGTVKDRPVAFLKFVLLPEFKAGTFQETITVVSEDPPAQAQLLVAGQKLGDITFTPDRLEFFPLAGETPDAGTILFESDETFHITKVEDFSGFLNISIETIEEGKKYKLTAKLENPPDGSFLAVVRIHTDLGQHPLIHIPVIGNTYAN